ncbi:Myb-like DNA-binding domain containing protein [Tritrichomonas foetus]|uniref:Myb-like DNA-binding domain containing protein n=1 Tax=Tritrichomonas foetus TaxID=1144522 RepID=A0A1J4K6E2_9EUKA|nr:Myb-like DNA-binding domain containing protein [Tritrichomonas foetus]|eukprot:OHT06456.1 Myb-like DNA-binding domain containing protein [Tritrichomonas foetus]
MSGSASENDILSSPVADRSSDSLVENFSIIKKTEPPGFNEWAECKKQAWLQLDVNPNAFFYRHVLPGEERKNGPWSEEEKQLFIKTLKTHPPSQGHWGLFARNIPGRVGYQCNAFFKKLVASGEVEGVPPKEGSSKTEQAPNVKTGVDDSNGETVQVEVRTRPKKPKTPEFVFNGDEYAYKYNILDKENFSFLPEDFQSAPAFHEVLLNRLKEPDVMERFVNNSNLYFKIGK